MEKSEKRELKQLHGFLMVTYIEVTDRECFKWVMPVYLICLFIAENCLQERNNPCNIAFYKSLETFDQRVRMGS